MSGSRWVGPETLLTAFLGLYVLVGMATVSSRGIPWDEPELGAYGRSVLIWYYSGFELRSAVDTGLWDLPLYGAAVEAPLETVAGLVGGDPYLVRHVLLGLLSILGLLGTYLLGARLGGSRVGLLAAVLLGLSPRFFAHGWFNSKDIPFAVIYLWSLHLLLKDLDKKIGSSLRSAVPLGLMTGLLLGIRVGGGIIFVPVLAGYAAKWWVSARHARGLVYQAARFAFVFLLAWGVMLLFWPWAQEAPLLRPMTALSVFSAFPHRSLELYGGALMRSQDLPIYYLPVWLLRTWPEAILIGLGLLGGLVLLGRFPIKRLLDPGVFSVAVAVGFPLAWVILSRANLYDGPRHLFFIQPFIALGAAAGILGAASRLPRRVGVAILGVVALAGAVTVFDAARLYPYEHVYFNRISGGLPAAQGRLELDYWGLSYKEGAEWLNENIQASKETSIASCSRPESTSHFLSEDFDFLGSLFFGVEGRPDYVLFTARHDCADQRPSGEVVHEIKRDGVTLLTILKTTPEEPGPSQGGSPVP